MWRFLNSIPRALKNYHGPRASVGVYVESDDKDKDQQDSPVIVNTEKESHNNNVVALTRNESSFCPFKHANVRGTTILWRLAGVRHPMRRLSGSAVDEQEDDRQHQPQSHRGEEREEGSLSSSQHHWWGITHKDFKYFFHGYDRILEALAAGSHYLWSPYRKKGQTYDLVFRVLFSIHGKETIVKTIRDQEGGDGKEEGALVTPQLPPSVGQTLLAIKDASGSEHDRVVNELKCDSLDAALKEFEQMCTDYSSQNESLLGIVAADSGDMSEAVKHFQMACALGNKTACFNVGLCFEMGNGVVRNMDKAKHYYELAARKGHIQAMYNLSLLYLNDGDGPSVDRRKGLEWMGMAAKAGLVQAQNYMGVYFMEEEGDPKKAVTYFRAAARQNDKEGQYFLALCHEQGLGVEVNECWAAHLYSLAASGGHDEAICCLARFTEQGLGGLPIDAHAAMDLYSRAAHFGNEEAKTRLEQLNKLEEEKAKMIAVNRMKHDQVSSSKTRLSSSSPGGDKKRSSLSSSSSTPSLTAPRPQSNDSDSGGNSGVSLSLTGMMYQRLWEFYQTCADTKRQFLFDHGGGNGDDYRISFQIGDDVDDRSFIGGHTTALDTAGGVNARDTLLLQTSCDCSHPPFQHLQQLQKSHTTPDLSSMVACNIR